MRLRSLPGRATSLAAPMLALRSLNAREHLGRFRAALQPRRGIFRCRYFASARGTKSLPCGLRARGRPARHRRVRAETLRDHLSGPANGRLQSNTAANRRERQFCRTCRTSQTSQTKRPRNRRKLQLKPPTSHIRDLRERQVIVSPTTYGEMVCEQ